LFPSCPKLIEVGKINLKVGCLVLASFLVSLALFLYRLDIPSYPVFDENYYTSAARQSLIHGPNENWSHPPLGKWLISQSISLFGDNTFGWRAMSAIFGAGSVALITLLAYILFADLLTAATVATLTLANGMLLVFSRLAMLDIFMIFFILAALIPFSIAQEDGLSKQRRLFLYLCCGIAFGLSVACKWAGVFPMAFCAILALRRHWREALVSFVGVPVLVYLVAFFILLFHLHDPQSGASYSLADVVSMQFEMLRAHLHHANSYHPYESSWLDWPLVRLPTPFSILPQLHDQKISIEAVICVLNPVVAWLGYLALFFLLRKIQKGNQRSLFLAGLFFSSWIPWALFHRATFFFHFFAAATFLPLILVDAIPAQRHRKLLLTSMSGAAIAFFIFLWPVLTAQGLSPSAASHRLWFSSRSLIDPIIYANRHILNK
jgi:dolichyl-phosphate-mannose-protein mannosyltransferase